MAGKEYETKAGKIIVFEKSIKYDFYHRPLFPIDTNQDNIEAMINIINCAYRSGAEETRRKVSDTLKSLIR